MPTGERLPVGARKGIENKRNLLEELRDNPGYRIRAIDVSDRPEAAETVRMYSPTLLIFNDSIRWNGPITSAAIAQIHDGVVPERRPYSVTPGAYYRGETRFLTEETVLDMAQPCGCKHSSCCAPKREWIRRIGEEYGLPHLGILHYQEGHCVGGAEFVPSRAVPYPVPKGEEAAFLTCSFLTDELTDYRSHPLDMLERELRGLGFRELLAVVSESVVFPNGPLPWFEARGYADQGEVCFEARDHARMHLVKKRL